MTDPRILAMAEGADERRKQPAVNDDLDVLRARQGRCRCHEAPEAWQRCPLPQHDHRTWTEHGSNCPASCQHRDKVAARSTPEAFPEHRLGELHPDRDDPRCQGSGGDYRAGWYDALNRVRALIRSEDLKAEIRAMAVTGGLDANSPTAVDGNDQTGQS